MSRDGYLPDSIDENDPNAPWNERTKEIVVSVNLSLYTIVDADLSDDDIRFEVIDELRRALSCTDFDIEEVIIEEDK